MGLKQNRRCRCDTQLVQAAAGQIAAKVRAQFADEMKREEPDRDEFSRQVETRIRDEFKKWKD